MFGQTKLWGGAKKKTFQKRKNTSQFQTNCDHHPIFSFQRRRLLEISQGEQDLHGQKLQQGSETSENQKMLGKTWKGEQKNRIQHFQFYHLYGWHGRTNISYFSLLY